MRATTLDFADLTAAQLDTLDNRRLAAYAVAVYSPLMFLPLLAAVVLVAVAALVLATDNR